MMDPIDQATIKSNKPVSPSKTSEAPETKIERISKLPRVKTKEIVQREKEADEQSKKAEEDRIKIEQKELTEVEPTKVTFTNTPEKYEKITKYVDMCKKINKIRDERVSISNNNIKKSKISFTYPMKPNTEVQYEEPAPELPLK